MEQCHEISSCTSDSETETESPLTTDDYNYMKTIQPYLSDELNGLMPFLLPNVKQPSQEVPNLLGKFKDESEFAVPISDGQADKGVSSTTTSNRLIQCVDTTPCEKLQKRGKYGFSIVFDEDLKPQSKSCNYTYSKILDKFFIQMDKKSPMKFSCDVTLPAEGFQIRSYLVFKDIDYRGKVVDRCPHHSKKQVEVYSGYVMDSVDERVEHAICESTKRYVTIWKPVSKQNLNTFNFNILFRCASSCRGGIDRKPILAVFELYVYEKFEGRAFVEVSICSSPGRDRENGEKKRKWTESSTVTTATTTTATETKNVKKMCICNNGYVDGKYLIAVNSLENANILRNIAAKMNMLDDILESQNQNQNLQI